MTARWWHLTVSCRPEDTDAVAAAIVTATGHGVEEPEPGVLSTALSTAQDAKALVGSLADRFAGLEGSVTELEPVDWTVRWRDGLGTRRFGRLVLTPSWLPVVGVEGEAVVTLDPETAFGSGEHGSTRAALTLLERHLLSGQRVLDFGSGSGILAIAAVQLGAESAVGIEVDDTAIPIAEANAERNGVADRVTFLLGDAGELHRLVGPVHLVCSNILRLVNQLLLPAIAEALRPGGAAVFSGMEETERELFLPVLAEGGWMVRDETTDGEWWAVLAGRPA